MSRTLLTAEIGINHGGDLAFAKKLIQSAYDNGADYVKLQKRTPRISTPKHMWEQPKETPWGTIEPYIIYREKSEFGQKEYNEIAYFCHNLGIQWFASAWDSESIEFLSQYDIPYIKIPSAMATNLDLIKHACRTRPTIVSTGMCDQLELLHTAAILPRDSGHWLMVCHSEYPVMDERELNLRQIESYRKQFPGIRIGFSSHSDSPFPAIYSSLLGAEMVEVHISLNRSLRWGDNSASIEPDGIKLIARELKRIDAIVGDGVKRLYPSELKAKLKLRGQ